MHNKYVRNSIIFLIVFLYVITARDELVNGLFSIWVGIWTMGKLFNTLFGPHQDFENLTVNDFIPNGAKILGLLFKPIRKQTFFMMIWWTSGVVVGLATYKLLEALLISP
jgi:hypothetical protein